jgi:molybdate transport system permease protein
MFLTAEDWQAIWLTLKLASITTILLIGLGSPLAWWLSRTRSKFKAPISAMVALPLVLPPTVIGFYFLMLLGPKGFVGSTLVSMGLPSLAFSFSGLVVASLIYSLPFVVQPLQNSFSNIGEIDLEAAATLGASKVQTFFYVVVPMAKSGFITAAILGFAHTVGEFGVILMVGGNIPGETQVVSVQIYQHVEALQYQAAHGLSLLLVVFSFVVLTLLYRTNSRQQQLIGSVS